jgi:hypothetical protein
LVTVTPSALTRRLPVMCLPLIRWPGWFALKSPLIVFSVSRDGTPVHAGVGYLGTGGQARVPGGRAAWPEVAAGAPLLSVSRGAGSWVAVAEGEAAGLEGAAAVVVVTAACGFAVAVCRGPSDLPRKKPKATSEPARSTAPIA